MYGRKVDINSIVEIYKMHVHPIRHLEKKKTEKERREISIIMVDNMI